MATTTEEMRHLAEIGNTDELAYAVVDGINEVTEKYKHIKDMGDRMAANGLAATVINATEKLNTSPFLVEVHDGAGATIFEDGQKAQENVHEFIADKVTNIDDIMAQFEYGKQETIRVFGLHCVARVIEYSAI